MIMKYKVNIPEGCKVMTVEVIDDRIILQVDKENQHQEFKENDIVTCETEGIKLVAIFKEKKDAFSFRAKALYTTVISQSDWCSYGERCRYATESEKQLLFDKLKEKCLMFDGKDIVRWRAEKWDYYWYISGNATIKRSQNFYGIWEQMTYESGNHFPTRELAEAFQKQYIELLNNFHKNL